MAFAGPRQLGLRPGGLARRQDPPLRRHRRQADLVAGRGRDAPKPIRTVGRPSGLGPRRSPSAPTASGAPPAATTGKVRLWSLADGNARDGPARPFQAGLSRRLHGRRQAPGLGRPDGPGHPVGRAAPARRPRGSTPRSSTCTTGARGSITAGSATCRSARDGAFLACCGLINASNPLGAVSNPAVLVLDWKTGAVKQAPAPQGGHEGRGLGRAVPPRRLRRSPPRAAPAAASSGSSKPDQENEFFKLALPNTARDLDLHPDGLQLATAHHDGIVRISADEGEGMNVSGENDSMENLDRRSHAGRNARRSPTSLSRSHSRATRHCTTRKGTMLTTAILWLSVSLPTAVSVAQVEVEEVVATCRPPNNGAGPLWCYGAPLLVRQGERRLRQRDGDGRGRAAPVEYPLAAVPPRRAGLEDRPHSPRDSAIASPARWWAWARAGSRCR